MRKLIALGVLLGTVGLTGSPQPAHACGGFFCGQQPVDQTAERVLFVENDNGTTTMIVQISYLGAAPDFAWIVPLADVPIEGSLDTFPQMALTGLDAQTGPIFQYPSDCGFYGEFDAAAGARAPSADEDGMGMVTVHVREEVGPYDVAVIESADPTALVEWLRHEDFRVTHAMEPYIDSYTRDGMKFLALKLQPDHEVSEISPFRMTLPGTSPSIPLKMTALAAEPEMSIVVFVVGNMRYGGANWPSVKIEDSDILWDASSYPMRTNYASLVAHAIDDVGGQGWTTEMAGDLDPLRELAGLPVGTPEQEEAQRALLDVFGTHPYITRLYTRLSAEEMVTDPVLRRVEGGDVDRVHMLSRRVDGRDLCDIRYDRPDRPTTPCDFVTCGAGGYCELTETADGSTVAGCACVPGATARTTFDPGGAPTVVCQDMRMSFLNPGDVELPGESPLPDPCVGFDCGEGGECVSMNMTPTCLCDYGLVAVGWIDETGSRRTECRVPVHAIPASFYNIRLPNLPASLPGGRLVETPPPIIEPAGGGCSVGGGAGGAGAALLGLVGVIFAFRRRRS